MTRRTASSSARLTVPVGAVEGRSFMAGGMPQDGGGDQRPSFMLVGMRASRGPRVRRRSSPFWSGAPGICALVEFRVESTTQQAATVREGRATAVRCEATRSLCSQTGAQSSDTAEQQLRAIFVVPRGFLRCSPSRSPAPPVDAHAVRETDPSSPHGAGSGSARAKGRSLVVTYRMALWRCSPLHQTTRPSTQRSAARA